MNWIDPKHKLPSKNEIVKLKIKDKTDVAGHILPTIAYGYFDHEFSPPRWLIPPKYKKNIKCKIPIKNKTKPEICWFLSIGTVVGWEPLNIIEEAVVSRFELMDIDK